MTKWLLKVGVICVAVTLIGCSTSVQELGPVNPEDVPEADATEVRKGMEESAKHLPQGVKMPEGVLPKQE